MQNNDFYTTTHLLVAAIRLLEHQNGANPSVEQVCHALSLSVEQGYLICNKLSEIEIIEMVMKEDTLGTRLFIQDHLKIEEIPRGEQGTSLQEEVEKFQNTKKEFEQKIEAFQAEKAERQKNLFAEIESKLKKNAEGNPSYHIPDQK
ncbi:MAG: hypothetical protein DRI57_14735 [Deltaproteobacteria bacterium]|nr:MAG: hypothetical protein DRI57_14735 [Deltaproteobacteria bacterium]